MACQLLQHNRLQCREDDPWDVFIADDDEVDPEPQPGDFWPEDDAPFTNADPSGDRLFACPGEVPTCSR